MKIDGDGSITAGEKTIAIGIRDPFDHEITGLQLISDTDRIDFVFTIEKSDSSLIKSELKNIYPMYCDYALTSFSILK